MEVYIAARFSRIQEAQFLAAFLEEQCGHNVISRWMKPGSDHRMSDGTLSEQAENSERERFATEDLEDLYQAEWLISLMEKPRGNGRGGRHVEFGYALGMNVKTVRVFDRIKMTIIGPRETVFHHLPEVQHFNTISLFKESMRVEQ